MIRRLLTLALLAFLTAMPAAALISEISIPNVGKGTKAVVTGRFAALVKNEDVKLVASLSVDGSNKGVIACDYKVTSTAGEYTFKVAIDFGRYVEGDTKVDAVLTLDSSVDGEFRDVKVSIVSPRDPT